MNKKQFLYAALFSLTLTAGFTFAQIPRRSSGAASKNTPAAIARLRRDYQNRDFADGYSLGEKFIRQSPQNTELRAWYILNMARSGIPARGPFGVSSNLMAIKAVAEAKSFQAKYPADPWANFALGLAEYFNLQYKDAAAPIDRALETAPDNEEFIFARANYLLGLGKYDEMNAWLDKNAAKINQPRALSLRAQALIRQSNQAANKRENINALFAQALELDPENINTNYNYAVWLNSTKQFAKALPILQKINSRSPNNAQNHQDYWTAIFGEENKTKEEKESMFAEDAGNYLVAVKNSPLALMIIAQKYGELKNTAKRDYYENLTLQKYPNTRYDEIVLFNRYKRAELAAGELSASDANRYRATNELGWSYIRRPVHFDDARLGVVYFSTLQYLGISKEATDEQLAQLIEGAVKYDTTFFHNANSEAAQILINGQELRPNSKLTEKAEGYARAGITEAESKTQPFPPVMKNASRGKALNTLGYVLTKEGKFGEAEQTLLEAKKLGDAKSNNPSMMGLMETTNYNLSQLYAAKKDYDKAEEYYLMDALDNKSAKDYFAKLYEQRTGNKNGFDDYYPGIRQKIKDRMRGRAIASKIDNPKDAKTFSLKTIDDKTISFDDLKGKIIVINVWGTWCAPCVGEMPQFQQLYKQYENDKDVAILSMDTNDELAVVRKFIADKKYDFPVLLGDSYTGNIMFDGGIAFPTTLFVDKSGKVSFVIVGNSENLLEEFGWRIDALKDAKQ